MIALIPEQMLIRNHGFSMIFIGILRVLLVKLRTSCSVTKGFVATAHYVYKSLETKFQIIESSFLDVALLLSIDSGILWQELYHRYQREMDGDILVQLDLRPSTLRDFRTLHEPPKKSKDDLRTSCLGDWLIDPPFTSHLGRLEGVP